MQRQRLLNCGIPGFHVRILEIWVHLKIVRRLGRIRNDPVRWNWRQNRCRETIFESSRLPVRENRRSKAGDGRVECVIRAYRKIIGVTVVGKWSVAHSESDTEHR